MPDLPIEPMAALMAQSAVPYGLLHAGTLNLQYANDALQKLYRQHVIVTGISLFGGCPDMQSALRQCRDTQTVQRFAHTAVGVEFELTPVHTGQGLQGIQCIALPGSKPHVQTDERYQRVLNGLPHNVWLCSPQGTIFWTNLGFCRRWPSTCWASSWCCPPSRLGGAAKRPCARPRGWGGGHRSWP